MTPSRGSIDCRLQIWDCRLKVGDGGLGDWPRHPATLSCRPLRGHSFAVRPFQSRSWASTRSSSGSPLSIRPAAHPSTPQVADGCLDRRVTIPKRCSAVSKRAKPLHTSLKMRKRPSVRLWKAVTAWRSNSGKLYSAGARTAPLESLHGYSGLIYLAVPTGAKSSMRCAMSRRLST